MSAPDLPDTEVITLEVGDQRVDLEQVADLESLTIAAIRGADEPHWAYIWPSARLLVSLVGEYEDLSGKRVLDLGCGPGAAGVAAARRGADVTLADNRPEAVALAARNLERNGLSGHTRVLDWNAPPEDLGVFDAVLAADVFYGDGMLRGVVRFLRRHLAPDGVALVADPNRVMPGGVSGAARLAGIDAHSLELRPGLSVSGGVTLYELRRRPPYAGR